MGTGKANNREDFPSGVVQALAERVGHMCSFPGCKSPTVGPSVEGPDARSRTGMACHIVAASGGPGARRLVPGTPPEELRHISNGIWMCYRHGKLVDTDEATYSIEMLKRWREIAEVRAQLSQELGRHVNIDPGRWTKISLVEEELNLTSIGDENRIIGEALVNCVVHEIWGDEVGHGIRDVLVELLRNAFQHGGATSCQIRIEPRRILQVDDGQEFNPHSMALGSRRGGGEAAIRQLERLGNHVLITSRRAAGMNETTVAFLDATSDLRAITPCTIEVKRSDLQQRKVEIPVLDTCHSVYVLIPEFFAISDANILAGMISGVRMKYPEKRIVFIVRQVSAFVKERLADMVSWATIIEL
jgi:hypothetical protein